VGIACAAGWSWGWCSGEWVMFFCLADGYWWFAQVIGLYLISY